ncbi:MAG: GNAT family N-acetyltransferase [Nanoarchaeota archaeon]|nr:GNAT family N-acetyltransferase [Nanoarchaeota archaeon]
MGKKKDDWLLQTKTKYPEKFSSENNIFKNINRGARIFVSTACAEPQYLIGALTKFVKDNPKSFVDAEVFHVWSLGVAPYADVRLKTNFRHNSFFLGAPTRGAVNAGAADYTPVFMSRIPEIFNKKLVSLDVALIQTSPPNKQGYLNLGISLDIVKAAIENCRLVITQVNSNMPKVHGHGFIHINDVDYIVPYDEPLLEYKNDPDSKISKEIGRYVAKLVQDRDTIQVGYGSIPNAILANLKDKKGLGIHTELLTDGLIELIKLGVVNNTHKSINRGKCVATFCMGTKETYDYINDNPEIEFRTVSYTNNPLIIAQNERMCAINSALEIDLTGQASSESLGKMFYSGIGGQADFMRGAILAKNGKSILTLQSTAKDGEISRIVPNLNQGAGVTLNRGDIHYVVTEYGIAYLHGKNIRERAMELISIAHPKFRVRLIKEAKKLNYIYQDQAYIPGKKGEYPKELETYKTTRKGLTILLRPVGISDEPLLKDLFYSLSDKSLYKRFISQRKDMPHERLQDFVVIDYTKEMIILAVEKKDDKETVLGIGQWGLDDNNHTAEVSFVVRDALQNQGIGTELLNYLSHLAKKRGILGFTAEVLIDNKPMMDLFEKAGFDIEKKRSYSTYELRMWFR